LLSSVGRGRDELMEKWDIFDASGRITGKTVVRGNVRLNVGEYHLVVHIWLLTPDGRIVIQRRADDKELMPGEWAAIGGAAVSGETSKVAAKRELLEEMGIDVKDDQISLIKRIVRKNSFVDIWLARVDITLGELTLQKSEVAEANWVTVDEFEKMVKQNNFHNYGNDYFDIVINALRNHGGNRL